MDGVFRVSNISFSDHLAIIGSFKGDTTEILVQIQYREMKEDYWQKFNINLRSIETRGSNTMEKWSNLSEDIKKTIECCFPLKTIRKNYTFTMST